MLGAGPPCPALGDVCGHLHTAASRPRPKGERSIPQRASESRMEGDGARADAGHRDRFKGRDAQSKGRSPLTRIDPLCASIRTLGSSPRAGCLAARARRKFAWSTTVGHQGACSHVPELGAGARRRSYEPQPEGHRGPGPFRPSARIPQALNRTLMLGTRPSVRSRVARAATCRSAPASPDAGGAGPGPVPPRETFASSRPRR